VFFIISIDYGRCVGASHIELWVLDHVLLAGLLVGVDVFPSLRIDVREVVRSDAHDWSVSCVEFVYRVRDFAGRAETRAGILGQG
jgi:hypothetical protein